MSDRTALAEPRVRFSQHSRLLIVQRVLAGRAAAHVAKEMGTSRTTVYRWMRRFAEEGVSGLTDRSSRPHTGRGSWRTRSSSGCCRSVPSPGWGR